MGVMADVLFDGEVWVHYGQLYVDGGVDQPDDMGDAFVGQSNGLCGAAVPGCHNGAPHRSCRSAGRAA
jgi:hypothetical protein